jgi:hypothetical protein
VGEGRWEVGGGGRGGRGRNEEEKREGEKERKREGRKEKKRVLTRASSGQQRKKKSLTLLYPKFQAPKVLKFVPWPNLLSFAKKDERW